MILLKILFLYIYVSPLLAPGFVPKRLQELPGKHLIVIGVDHRLRKTQVGDERIGFEVRQLIAQGLADSGRFLLLEHDPDILEKLKQVQRDMWEFSDGDYDLIKARQTISRAPDWIAWGRVTRYRPIETKTGWGLRKKVKWKVFVDLQVSLLHVKSGVEYSHQGSGQAITSARATVFEIRGEKVFSNTAIGMATQKAVNQALAGLLEKIPESL